MIEKGHIVVCACVCVSVQIASYAHKHRTPLWFVTICLSIGHNHGTNQITTSISTAFVILFC